MHNEHKMAGWAWLALNPRRNPRSPKRHSVPLSFVWGTLDILPFRRVQATPMEAMLHTEKVQVNQQRAHSS